VKNHFYSQLRKKIRKYNRSNSPKLTGSVKKLLKNKTIAAMLITPPTEDPEASVASELEVDLGEQDRTSSAEPTEQTA
jgi:hypothetical protein